MTPALIAYEAELRADASDPDLCDADRADLEMRADECRRAGLIMRDALAEMRV